MTNDIKLTVELPTKVFLEQQVHSVIVPAVRADIQILSERAPSVFVLDYGLLQILDAKGEVVDKYYIYSGVVDVAENECKVMTQGIIAFDDINLLSAKERLETAKDENERLFYTMIINSLQGKRERYIKTLDLQTSVA